MPPGNNHSELTRNSGGFGGEQGTLRPSQRQSDRETSNITRLNQQFAS